MAYKQNQEVVCLLIICLDDILIVRIQTIIKDTTAKLRKSFSIKEIQYLAWLGQLTILMSLERKFGGDVAKLRTTPTSGTPGYVGTKAQNEEVWFHLNNKPKKWSGDSIVLDQTFKA